MLIALNMESLRKICMKIMSTMDENQYENFRKITSDLSSKGIEVSDIDMFNLAVKTSTNSYGSQVH